MLHRAIINRYCKTRKNGNLGYELYSCIDIHKMVSDFIHEHVHLKHCSRTLTRDYCKAIENILLTMEIESFLVINLLKIVLKNHQKLITKMDHYRPLYILPLNLVYKCISYKNIDIL